MCHVRPRRFGRAGSIIMRGGENAVRYNWLTEVWTVDFQATTAMARRSGTHITVVVDSGRGTRMFRMHALFVSRISPFIVREVLDENEPYADDERNPICAQFGGDSYFSILLRNISSETYAFLFFLYVITIRTRRRRICFVDENL